MTTEIAKPAEFAAQLDEVERRLREVLTDTRNPFVTEAATHLIEAGGKRLRPLLVLLGSSFGKRESDQVVTAAVIAELVHVGTLYHDDVMDEAKLRHGVETANTRWSNTIAVLLGDYLLARAAGLGATLGDKAMRLQVQTLSRLVKGQIDETVGATGDTDAIEHCLRVMADKSASLISMAVVLGATVSEAEPYVVDLLGQYGELLGVAFQITDDLLDISAQATELGKEPGTDLREGIVTLPVLYALAEPGADRLRELVESGAVREPLARAESLTLLRESPGLDRARQEALRRVGLARDLLFELPDVPARASLAELCDFVLDRVC
ncbi:polyprenyl synthetase family protein [Amycolatopsis nigrescens]|uniref:polyprenyl synthetase family protein n=1 Tax=Amycolatopsis nigrescens TaxID=381445 RepID=UPI00036B94A8|nr:polyprenyl synthetase family protein [Amycolatopsis nigrescens]